MRLWLLKRTDQVGYDEYQGFVVRAETEEQARAVALEFDSVAEVCLMSCTPIEVEGEAEVILESYHAG